MPDPLLQVSSLTTGYHRNLPILHDVSINIAKGQIVTLIGPNGAGKSTLVKAVANLISIHSGEILLSGTSIEGYRADQMSDLGIAYVPQLDNVFRSLTVHQNLTLAAARVRANRAAAIGQMLDLFPALDTFASRRAGALSGGQRQMLAIAMALVARPQLVLMDEPTAGLSPSVAQDVLTLIQRTASGGVAVLLVEQNAKAALAISDHAYVLAEGRNQIDGKGPELLKNPTVGEIYLGAYRRTVA